MLGNILLLSILNLFLTICVAELRVMSKFKFLCALFMVVAMNVNVNAQSYLTNSYKGYVDAGYSIGIGDYEFGRVEINTSHGYQFTPYFFLGAGGKATRL